MGLADFDFLPSVPQTFWGFPPFLLLLVNTAKIPLGVLYLNLVGTNGMFLLMKERQALLRLRRGDAAAGDDRRE